MTISGRVVVAKDVFADNEVFRLSRAVYPKPATLSGIAWLRREPPTVAHLNALTMAVVAVQQAFPAYSLLLLGAHTARQPTSLITRHRRLWKSLEARGVRIPRGARTEEVALTDEGGTRWFGVISIANQGLAEAVEALEAERASLVVAVPVDCDPTVDHILSSGWASPMQGPPPEIIDWIGSNDGVVFWAVGAFDDVESGVVAFGAPEIVERLANIYA